MGITTKSDIALVALKANTASLALTASYFSGSISNATSASYALTASYLEGSIANAISASYASTASYADTASVALSASVTQNPGTAAQFPLVFVRNSDTITNLNTDSASLFYTPINNTLTTTSSRAISASIADGAVASSTVRVTPDTSTNTFYSIPFASTAFGNAELYADSSVINFNPSTNRLFITSVSSSNITGSSFTGSFTGSLFGTASRALTASFFSGSISNAISASFASTASFFSGSISNAISSSYANTASLAQRVEIVGNSTEASAFEILFANSTGSQIVYAELNNFYYVPASDTLFVDNISVSQSLTARGVSLTGSFSGSLVGTASWANNVISASFASTASRATSASFASTSSYVTPYEGAWISYTPVWTAASVNPVIGNGTITGQYKVIGKTCFVRGNVAMGSTTTFGTGEWYISMPFTASHADAILMTANLLDNGAAWYNATVNGARAGFNYKTAIQYQAVGGTANDINATQPFTWANSDRFLWNGSFETA
jgi:hypothetical protein